MAKIAVRAEMDPEDKIYGQLPNRFIMGRQVVNLDFSVLNLLDSKRYFRFFDRKIASQKWREAISYGNLSSATGSVLSMLNKIMMGPRTLVNDYITPPLFYSSSMSGNRNFAGPAKGAANFASAVVGYFKGPGNIFTIDNTGNAGDFLAPGMKLMVSQTGLVHTYTDDGPVDVLYYPANNTTAREAWAVSSPAELPVILGYNPWAACTGYPYAEQFLPTSAATATSGYIFHWSMITYSKLIHQDATYIVYMQMCDGHVSISNYEYASAAPPDKFELIAIRKSDGYMYNIVTTSTHLPTSFTGRVVKSTITTEATPQKACIFLQHATSTASKAIFFNKIIGSTITNVSGSSSYLSYFYGQTIPTQIMENKAPAFSTHWKCYYPMYNPIAYDNTITLQLYRFNKTLTAAPTITACTITGLPAEYASTNGNFIKNANTPKTYTSLIYDIVYAAEIYDGTDQYVAYWIGVTRNPWFNPDFVNNCYSEMSDTQYRYFLVFKVDPTDDSKLTYQSCVPEIKYAKPIHCAVASADNKYIALANPDGVFCLVWDTNTKAFICTDTLAMPGVVSMGMDETQPASKATVFCEVLSSLTDYDDTPSYVYQIDFGDYEDVDLRYFNGTAYVSDFGFSNLTLAKDGNGNYVSQTISIEVRVKNRVAGVETQFVSGKTVKLQLSGIRSTDGVAFVDCDSGIPFQKTITTNSAWQTVQFTIQYPVSGMKIGAEITA